ncbi:LapA family protein [Moorena sp. SIOASIH]|uniref:LapA family protein n=1 Tax=Moorena sp. SIOASIH TaxID=2607817 RepID=UPI0025D648BF|nr:LapA family protein [Moorena sp. SIOASIH]
MITVQMVKLKLFAHPTPESVSRVGCMSMITVQMVKLKLFAHPTPTVDRIRDAVGECARKKNTYSLTSHQKLVTIMNYSHIRVLGLLLTSLIVAIWIGAIAIFSIQNITEVSVKFLVFESIDLPIGVVLAVSVGIGLVGGAIAPLVWQLLRQSWKFRDSEDEILLNRD